MTETILYIMELIVGAVDPLYAAIALTGIVAGMVVGAMKRRKSRAGDGTAGSIWLSRSLMTKDEAKAILPALIEAAEGMYVFPKLLASTVLQRSRKAGAPRAASGVELNEVVLDYSVYTSECELVCVVLVDYGKRSTSADKLRADLLRSAEVPVIKIRPGQMPEAAVLRAHLQLALDQRRVTTSSPKHSKSAGSGRLAVA